MSFFRQSVEAIDGIGPATAEKLAGLGIETVGQLARWFPRDYLDATQVTPVVLLRHDQLAVVRVQVVKARAGMSQRTKIKTLEVTTQDEDGAPLTVWWFRQDYLKDKMKPGVWLLLIGKVTRQHGKASMMSPIIEKEPRILPVYPQTAGVTSRMFRTWLGEVAERAESDPDSLPAGVAKRSGLLSFAEALRLVHRPASMAETEIGRKYFAIEELTHFIWGIERGRVNAEKEKGIAIAASTERLQAFVKGLPFSLTDDQRKAAWQVVQDMADGAPMGRLLNGDVGSGKTAVAAVAAFAVAETGWQTVVMAPTEILAQQHAETFKAWLEPFGHTVALYTASVKEDADAAAVIVGTQALLHREQGMRQMALLVVDEQHRFGVRQRQWLQKQQPVPHVLSMTATPIPRTLALALYGNLDISYLREKPGNRQPVSTAIVRSAADREEMYLLAEREVRNGGQVLVVCPLVEPVDAEGTIQDEKQQVTTARKAAKEEVIRLQQERPGLGEIGLLYGGMKPKEKAAVMRALSEKKLKVAVATSVIEVGIDLPDATVMIIEGAERFGLAQLHQLRGRIGRGTKPGFAFLCPEGGGAKSAHRLQTLVESDDGFELAQADLEQRGPGELTGAMQSGLPDFRMASLTDTELIEEVRGWVREAYEEDPKSMQAWPKTDYSIVARD